MRSFKTACLLVAAPIAEFLALRLFLRHVLELRLGYPGLTDYDFVFPSLIAFFTLVFFLERERPLRIGWNRKGALLNLLLFVTFGSVSAFYGHLAGWAGSAMFPGWAALAVVTLFSALFVCAHPREFLLHPRAILIVPALLAGGSIVLGRHALSFLWHPATQLTGQLACGVLTPFVSGLSCGTDVMVRSSGPYQVLDHPLHTVVLGVGCGGMEGVVFFLFVSALLVVALADRLGVPGSIAFVGLGAIAIYLVNVVRVCIYYVAVLGAGVMYGNSAGVLTLRVLFHNALGWVV